MIRRKNLIGDRVFPYYLDEVEAVDVDTILDFLIAEFIYKNKIDML